MRPEDAISAVRAERDQLIRELDALRALITNRHDGETIPVGAIRVALRNGPAREADRTFAAIVAPVDDRLSPNDRHVIDLATRSRDTTLDGLCARTSLPKPHVFYAVARLEELGYLTTGAIR